MTGLEDELVELGAHLAHGDGEWLVAAVGERLGAPARRDVPWLKLAAALVVALGVALALPPSRKAIARFFGIGAVQIRTVPTTLLPPGGTAPPVATVPGAVETTTSGQAPTSVQPADADVTAAQARVSFPIRTVDPGVGGPLRRVDLDERVPGGLVALVYDRFTLVEVASDASTFPIMGKLAPPGVTVRFLQIAEGDAVWVQGAHEIAYLDPDGAVRTDTVRRAGSVLVWARDGVTFRVEGLDDLDEAERIAAALR